jgi:8-oxo-dGTP diphosphatase
MIEATLCLLVRDTDPREILLGRKKRGFGAGKLNGFGGKPTAGESLEACAVREVYEEVGLTVAEDDLRRVGTITFRFPSRPDYDHRVYVFAADRWHGDPTETEEMAPAWFSICALPFDRMWQDDAYWLPIALNGRTLNGEFEYGDDNETVVSWRIGGAAPAS